jgi:hypothetical protein
VLSRSRTVTDLHVRHESLVVQPVERAEYEGIDYGWVMQTTFVLTILVGAPVVAVLSAFVTLESWSARAAFAVRVGAPIWFLTAVAVALYARRTDAGDGSSTAEDAGAADPENDDAAPADGNGDNAPTAADETGSTDKSPPTEEP